MHIVWLSESPILSSGYGTQTYMIGKEFVKKGHKFSVIALNHPTQQPQVVEGIHIYPIPGNGSSHAIRNVLNYIKEKIDIFVVFIDIHFVHYIFPENERDIKERCPFVLYHLWDNEPAPIFNKNIYKSLSKVICASEFSYKLLKDLAPRISYVPIGADPSIFKPLSRKECIDFKRAILKNKSKKVNFIIGSTNANILRKRLADLVVLYDKFAKGKDDVALLLHCGLHDPRGVDLELIRHIFIGDNKDRYLIISPAKGQDTAYINKLYNMCDVTVNIAHSEGFGLQTVESMMAGVPPVVGDFGNHQYMVGDAGMLIPPAVSHVTAGFGANFIYEHYVSDHDVIDALDKLYYNRDVLYQYKSKCRNQGLQFSIYDTVSKLEIEFNNIIIESGKTAIPEFEIAVL